MKCPTHMFLTRVTSHEDVCVEGYRDLPTVLRIFTYFTYSWVYFEERCYWSVNDSCPFLMFSYVWCGSFFRGEAFALDGLVICMSCVMIGGETAYSYMTSICFLPKMATSDSSQNQPLLYLLPHLTAGFTWSSYHLSTNVFGCCLLL